MTRITLGLAVIMFLATLGLILAACTAPRATPTPTATLRPIPTSTPSPTSTPPLPLASPVSSSAVAVSPDGSIVAAVNPDSDSITLVNRATLDVLQELTVGDDPCTLVFTPDSQLVLVANHGSATVSMVNANGSGEVIHIPVGPTPYGVVTDGMRAYVAEFSLGNVSVIDLATGSIVTRIPVEGFPAGLALDATGGTLIVTHLFSGRVTGINASNLAIFATAATGADTNLSQSVTFHPDGSKVFLPQTRSNATNVVLIFDATVLPVVNVLDLDSFSNQRRQRITIDTADKPVNMPFDVVFSPDGATMYVVHAGSDNVSVIDLATSRAAANLPVGANPRGIAITPDGSRLFVNNTLSGTLSVIDTASNEVTATLALTTIPLEPDVLVGKRIFNSASSPDLTTDNWISCAVCHFDGTLDARTWAGFPDGPRSTPSLLGVGRTLPIHWSGDLDELADVELTIRNIQAGKGLTPGDERDSLGPRYTNVSEELNALAAYLDSLEVPPSPLTADANVIARGRAVFETLNCSVCHTPPLYTDRQLHDVGTSDPVLERNSHGRGTSFDTPSLRGLWMTAPYFHDGTAATLEDVFTVGHEHFVLDRVTAQEIIDLIDFLFALPLE